MLNVGRIAIMVVVGVVNWLIGYYFGHKDGWKNRIDYEKEQEEDKAEYMNRWRP